MPVNKRGFKPTASQNKLNAPTITISKPYPDPYANKTFKVDVTLHEWNGSGFERTTIEGVSESVAQQITKAFAKNISTARSEKTMQKYVKEAKSLYFNRNYGRASILMNNLASEGGMGSIFSAGLRGSLSPTAQENFDKLMEYAEEISKDRLMVEQFYKRTQDYFQVIGSQYYRFKQNFRAISQDDSPDVFSNADVKEVEKALEKIIEIAEEFVGKGQFVEGNTTSGRRIFRQMKW